MPHDERLRPPWTWWLLVLAFSAAVWWSLLLATPLWFSGAVGLGTLALTSWALARYGSVRVAVEDGAQGAQLVAGRARVPVAVCGEPTVLDAAAMRHRLGPGADARAYVLTRPYAREGVLVPLHDPQDPTPYWVVASRRPSDVAAALRTLTE